MKPKPTVLGVSRTFALVLLAAFATVALAIIGLYVTSTYRRHVHSNNMVKAEQFKREFDRQLPAGASREAVEKYLATQHIIEARPHPLPDSREYWVTIIRETSPNWYCGTQDVGVILHFSESQQLVKADVESWSFDCL